MQRLNKSLFPLLAFFLLSAQRVEIYEDWQPDAVGESSFQNPAHGMYYKIGTLLEKKGFSIRHWDRKAHRPFLLSWKSVQNWTDFKNRLGLGLPRKQPLEKETAYLIFSNLGVHLRDLNLGRMPKEQLILFIWEPATVQPEIWNPKIHRWFKKIYTWHDDWVDGVQFFKFHLPFWSERIPEIVPYEERKFLTLICSRLSSKHPNELYSEREKLIRFFEKQADVNFDLYGRYWGKRKFSSWKGEIPDKLAVLKNYRFAIAYENSAENGYITEKLWDCFAAGVVPIYLGAPNVTNYIPSDCFIDRRKFATHQELLAFLQDMSQEEWEGYLKRAEAFLHSEAARKFSPDSYAGTFVEAISRK